MKINVPKKRLHESLEPLWVKNFPVAKDVEEREKMMAYIWHLINERTTKSRWHIAFEVLRKFKKKLDKRNVVAIHDWIYRHTMHEAR